MITRVETFTRRVLQKLWSRLDKTLMPYLKDGIILAVSGGPDSRALLEAVATWKHRNQRFVVAILDHGLREQSRLESLLVYMRAQRLGFISCSEAIFSPEGLGESELRNKRYAYFSKIAKKYDCKVICTAHHADDSAEGFLMSILGFGGGVFGEAIQEVTTINDLLIIRPFCSLTKAELLAPLALLRLTDYAHDNLDRDWAGRRALVRHAILPSLAPFGHRIKKRLAFISEKQLLQNEDLRAEAQKIIQWGDNNEAFIDMAQVKKPIILEMALKLVLKRICKNKDLRSQGAILSQTIESISKASLGLDHELNCSKLRNLRERGYFFPGAKVFLAANRQLEIKGI